MEDQLNNAFDECYEDKYFDDEFELIRSKSAFKAGYKYAMSHLWNKISDLLPRYDTSVIVNCSEGVMIAHMVDLGTSNVWISEETGLSTEINSNDLWMEIPNT